MNTRYFGLDFARATLMLLGIVFHSSLIYSHNSDWHTSYTSHSEFFNTLSEVIHYFRMNAFYMIAGFFFVLVVEKYGVKKTLLERLIKLGVPLLVVGFTFNAFITSLYQDKAPLWSFEYISQGQWVYHLWFIGNLLVYYLAAIWFVARFTCRNTSRKLDSVKKIAFLALLVTPLLSIALTLVGGKIAPTKVLFLTFEALLGYFPYFVLGMYFWQQKERVFSLMNMTNAMKLLLVALLLIMLMQSVDLMAIRWSLYLLVVGFAGGFLAMTVIIWLNFIGNKSSKLVGKLTESSYTVYLLHEPLIVFVFVTFLAALELNLYISFALLCSIVLGVSYFVHFGLVKKSHMLMFLFNGKMKTVQKPLDEKLNAG